MRIEYRTIEGKLDGPVRVRGEEVRPTCPRRKRAEGTNYHGRSQSPTLGTQIPANAREVRWVEQLSVALPTRVRSIGG